MNKFVVSALAFGVFLGASIASQAQIFTYNLVPDATPYTTFPGVSPTSGNDLTLTNVFQEDANGNPQTYNSPSVVNYGDDFTLPGTGLANRSGTYTNVPVTFNFQLDNGASIGATAHDFTAFGHIDGTVGYGPTGVKFSTARVTYTQIVDNTTGQVSILSIDPNDGLVAVYINPAIGGFVYNVYLDSIQNKPAPGNTIVHSGFISTVPEPGAVAMIAGMGIFGSLFAVRIRRRK